MRKWVAGIAAMAALGGCDASIVLWPWFESKPAETESALPPPPPLTPVDPLVSDTASEAQPNTSLESAPASEGAADATTPATAETTP